MSTDLTPSHVRELVADELRRRAVETDPLLTEAEAAEVYGCSQKWFQRRRVDGTGPTFVRLSGGLIRYRRSALDEWARQNEHQSTTEYAS